MRFVSEEVQLKLETAKDTPGILIIWPVRLRVFLSEKKKRNGGRGDGSFPQ